MSHSTLYPTRKEMVKMMWYFVMVKSVNCECVILPWQLDITIDYQMIMPLTVVWETARFKRGFSALMK